MTLKYAKLTNEASKEYSILLHGVVGVDIDCIAVAKEIKFLNESGANKITQHINSIGGYINDGFSIVSANLNSKATIETINEGTADSMALVILASGDKGHRIAMDYSTGIIHDPLIGGVTLEDVADIKLKSFMQNTKEQLVTIFENTTGKSRDEISAAMKEELMLTSSQLLEFGIVDSVKTSKKQPKIKTNASAIQRMAACSEFINTQKMEIEYKEQFENVSSKLKATNEALETTKAENVTLLDKVKDLEAKNSENEAKLAEFQKSAIASAVNNAINSGKFEETQREFLTNQATKDLEGFVEMVSNIKDPQLRATDIINGKAGDDQEDENDTRKWDWEMWEKKDPHGLALMEETNPERYQKLYSEDQKKYK